ncbi:DUF3489 domain-containing protein [Cognatiyoonia sp. IB215182]|uniref:DUF3489 domain-containing protein n=1 Tax=Cognatiyoonia sp. IB215182 TaxID=3097353 RepID=UPI002A133AAD|nr:DUF3489 domain-containing protein [Cognatiyoonia sp. IB215182]MDX8352435.1 DUF3489 domain-containing protein [Cognatiyoonia sp. IB215182]
MTTTNAQQKPACKPSKPTAKRKTAAKHTRKSLLIKALSKAKPVTAARLATSLSLQPHSVRAAISGLRKEGLVVETIKSPSGGPASYRIAPQVDESAQQGNDS